MWTNGVALLRAVQRSDGKNISNDTQKRRDCGTIPEYQEEDRQLLSHEETMALIEKAQNLTMRPRNIGSEEHCAGKAG